MVTKFRLPSPLFAALVLLPTLLAVIYFGFLAENTYQSESRILVRSPSKPDASPLGSVLGAGSIAGATEESNAVREFLQSREALRQIDKDGFVRKAYTADSVFVLDRFGGLSGDSFEQFHEYFADKVTVEDGASIIALRLRVEAFTPEAAREINERLLRRSEQLVNALSQRARTDSIGFANEEVARARDEAQAASVRLARFRDQAGVIDPELQARVGLQTISQLQEELIDTRTQLIQMQTYTPRATQIPFLKTQVRELEREIARQTSGIAGGARSLSSSTARYQELSLASEFAAQQLTVALASLQEAQAEARRKQAYVERIAEPSLPDYPEYPRRLRSILATFVLGLLAWGVVSMLLVGVREHRD